MSQKNQTQATSLIQQKLAKIIILASDPEAVASAKAELSDIPQDQKSKLLGVAMSTFGTSSKDHSSQELELFVLWAYRAQKTRVEF